MTAWIVAVAVVILVPVLYVIAIFNRLVNLRNLVHNAWSNVDTELKRRYDLIPNLAETVQGYSRHERDVFERVADARARALASTGSPQSQARDENELVRALRQLLVVAENYPELKASQHYSKLEEELIATENRIQAARRFYNGNVKDINNLVEQFPSSLVARAFGFTTAEFFEIENAVASQPVQVQF
jgi:LemA protein